MHAIEKRNRKIFGDAHVDRLKAKHAEWKRDERKVNSNRPARGFFNGNSRRLDKAVG